MDFTQLRQAARDQALQVNIASYEGGIYLLEVIHAAGKDIVREKNSKKPLIYKCIETARDDLQRIGIDHPALVHDNVTDEMIGFGTHYDESEAMQMRL